jgi:hypothetical protein
VTMWITYRFNYFYVGNISSSVRSGGIIFGTGYLVLQARATRGNRSYLDFFTVTDGRGTRVQYPDMYIIHLYIIFFVNI